MSTDVKSALRMEQVGDVTIARFLTAKVVGETMVRDVTKTLYRLAEADGPRKVVLDLSGVEYISSGTLSIFITLHNRLKAAGGQLRFCNLHRNVLGVITITKLDQLFNLHTDRDAALAGF